MNDRVVDLVVFALGVVAIAGIGGIGGAVLTVWILDRERRGHRSRPLLGETVSDLFDRTLPADLGAGTGKIPHNAEASAHRQISAHWVKNGAREILERARAQGVNMSQEDAEETARSMLLAQDPLGGVR